MKSSRIIYLIYLLPIALLAYLFWQNAKPVLELRYDLRGRSAMVSGLVPVSRVSGLEKDKIGPHRVVNSEPVYLEARLPRQYKRAEIDIEYSDLRSDIFEVGVLRGETQKSFKSVALGNNILDGLNWFKIEKDGLALYERRPAHRSIKDFLNKPASFNQTLVYRTNLEPVISGLAQKGKTIIDFPIKENVRMMVYHAGGRLGIVVSASGEYRLNIYKNNQPIAEQNNLGKGIYMVELVGGENTVFNKVTINSSYAAILDGLNLGKLEKPLKIYFAGSQFLARAQTAGGIQKITIDKDSIEIGRAQEQYKRIFSGRGPKVINVPSGSIELGGALFFINDNIFYPRYENLYAGADLRNVDFILAKYTPPTEDRGMKRARAAFDIRGILFPGNKIRFLLSLQQNGDNNELIKIRGIKIKFTGDYFSLAHIWNKTKSQLSKIGATIQEQKLQSL